MVANPSQFYMPQERVVGMSGHIKSVKNFIKTTDFVMLSNIVDHLGLTKIQALIILDEMEKQKIAYCKQGYWHLRQEDGE